jgi:hypothetical protein
MAYMTVFQVSDRLVEIPLGAVLLLAAGLAVVLMIRNRAPETISLASAVVLVVGGLGSGLLLTHHTGDLLPLPFFALWSFGWTFGIYTKRGLDDPRRALLRTRFVWVFRMAPVVLLLAVGATGTAELPALDLNNRLAAGDGTVRTGVVDKIVGKSGSYGCFWLSGQEYCYSANGVGYSLTPGGPVAAGDSVRITWIGDTIVKVEVLRPTP